jgi:hypothetical protein
MATDIEPADVEPTDMAAALTVTPGAARVPMTGVVDATEVFLGVRHRDYSEEEQKMERNKKRHKTTNILDRDSFTSLYVRAEDRMHAWKKLSQRLEAVKSRRMEKMYKKLREGRQKLISNNQRDLTYSSGMMMETEAEEEARSRKTRSTTGERRCSHCNEDSHQRRTSRLCPKNKRNLDRPEAASMRDAQKTREGKYHIREPYVLYNVVNRIR